MATEARKCQNCKQDFTIKEEDFAFYTDMKVPPPTFCPECRMIRRFMFRNEHFLFRRKEALEGKEIFSGFPPKSPYKIYEYSYWWSDKWEATDYARDYDFSRPFFAQFHDLLKDVPLCARALIDAVDSEYCEQAAYAKSSYLCFDVNDIENSAYLISTGHTKDSYNTLSTFYSELCYETTRVRKGYKVFYSDKCDDCNDVWLSKNCSGCTNCFGCVNLRNKSYYIYNQPYTKEEYEKKLESLGLNSHSALHNESGKAYDFWNHFPVRYLSGQGNVKSDGDYLDNTKGVGESFLVSDTENSKFLQLVDYKCANSYDYTLWGSAASRIYETLSCGLQVDSIKFCFDCWPSSTNLEYCVYCRSSSDLFGCVGLRNKQYCIFNKQYTKDEYFALRAKIIEHMSQMPYIDSYKNSYAYGEFFPPEFSPFAYNETLAQDFFPLSKEEALAKGHPWQDPDLREYAITLKSSDLPDKIEDVPDSIISEVIQCEDCSRAYRIIEPELKFLRTAKIPLPRKCIACRLKRRFSLLNQPRFYKRSCGCAGESSARGEYKNIASHSHGSDKCSAEFETSYAPDRPELVYCEACYNTELA